MPGGVPSVLCCSGYNRGMLEGWNQAEVIRKAMRQLEICPHRQGAKRQDHQRDGHGTWGLMGVMTRLGRDPLIPVKRQEESPERVERRQARGDERRPEQ